MEFGENLSSIRKEQNVTQESLAEYLKVSRSTIAGYETRNREPEYRLLIQIADFFGVSVDMLLGRNAPKQETIPTGHAPTPEQNTNDTQILTTGQPACMKHETSSKPAPMDVADLTTQEQLDILIYYASSLSQRDLDLLIAMSRYMNQ